MKRRSPLASASEDKCAPEGAAVCPAERDREFARHFFGTMVKRKHGGLQNRYARVRFPFVPPEKMSANSGTNTAMRGFDSLPDLKIC